MLVIGEDDKKKAFHVTGPEGASPLVSILASAHAALLRYHKRKHRTHARFAPGLSSAVQGSSDVPRGGFSGRGGMRPYDPGYAAAAAAYGAAAYAQQQQIAEVGRGRGSPSQGFFQPMPPEAYMGAYYPMSPAAGYPGFAPAAPMYPRGRGGFFPGGKNWAGARPPPPGQPGFSSGLQVVVHNLPWDCTWQQLKDAFSACGEIDRADVVFDSRGRSRGFGIVRFPNPEAAEKAVERMNNATIGGRVVSVRLDRFA